MHLAECHFFTHLTALIHLQNLIKKMHPAVYYFTCTYMHGISLRIIIEDDIITQTLINETTLNCGFIWVAIANPKQQFKGTILVENILFIKCFYAIMHRTTIAQNKIINIIYS